MKGVTGTIQCCLGLTIEEQKSGIFTGFEWHFRPDPRLRMNITFMGTNLIQSYRNTDYEYLLVKSDFSPSSYLNLYIKGKTSIFTILMNWKILKIFLKCFPSKYTKINLIFSVFDKSLITFSFFTRRTVDAPKSFSHKFMYHTIFYNNLHYKTFHIALNKLQKVKLRFIQQSLSNTPEKRQIELHDGPDDQTKIIKNIGSQIILSTFQCYLKVYAEQKHHLTAGISISSVKQKILHNIEINSSVIFSLDMCGQKDPLHCIIKLNTMEGYLNMSLKNMTYTGPNSIHCLYGGITYHGINVKMRNYLTSLCDSYTQTPENNSFDKVPMNYVSTESKLLIIVYCYHPYNRGMDLNLDISLSPYRGIICLNDRACK